MMKYLFILFLFTSLSSFAQQTEIFKIDSLPSDGVLLNKNWEFHVGDNPDFAKPDFDDSAWESIDPTLDIKDLPQIFDSKIKWLRLDFEVKNKFSEPIGLSINQVGASEIYLNGRLVKQIGHFDLDLNKVIANDPRTIPIYLPVDSPGKYNLAIRYVLQPNIHYTKLFKSINRFFNASLVPLAPTINSKLNYKFYHVGINIFKFGIFLMLFILHVAFYFNQKNNKAHLFLILIFLVLAEINLSTIAAYIDNIREWFWYVNLITFSYNLSICLQLAVLYYFAKLKIDFWYWAVTVFVILLEFLAIFSYNYGGFGFLLGIVVSILFMLRVTIIGIKKKIRGFKFLSVGLILNILAYIFITLYDLQLFKISIYLLDLIFNVGLLAFPIGLSIFMGLEAGDINKELTKNLTENEILKEEAVNQEKEKQQILATQNETLERQVTERTNALSLSLRELKATQNQLIQSEKLASLGELTAGIAHEIQNPLNFVNNFSELNVDLVKDIKDEIHKLNIDKVYVEDLLKDLSANEKNINHHGKRAASIVSGMLEHSRSSTGKKEWTDVNKLADEYFRLSFHGLRAKNKDFNSEMITHFDTTIPKIEIIPQDIGRVILNLINNAFYAVNERRTMDGEKNYEPIVTVTTLKTENAIEIKVKDNGTGMPENVRQKVFQPFFTTKPTGQGTGLGLSLAYDIITKGHGGSLSVESTEGVGSEFVISLPMGI